MDYKDYYAILGVARDASQEEIQKTYKKLARKFHPDVNTSTGAEDRFKEVGEAYEALKDPEKRATYDRYGTAWKAAQRGAPPPPGSEHFQFDFGNMGAGFGGGGFGGGGFAGGSGFSSFFDMLFNQRSGQGGDPRARGGAGFAQAGADQEAAIVLSLEEAAQGGKREITVAEPSGERKTYTVNIPAGVRPGGRIRLRGKGAPGWGGGPRGDLYLKIDVLPHPRFRLDGHDIRTDLEVTPWEAALGSQVPVDTLSSRLSVRIPPGSSSGRVIRLRDQGFPLPDGGKGDLLAEIKIVLPETLSDEERSLFEQLAETSSFRARPSA